MEKSYHTQQKRQVLRYFRFVVKPGIIEGMIAHLTGSIVSLKEGSVILDVGGVGYRIGISGTTSVYIHEHKHEPISLFTHLAVRENALDLFGFVEESDLNFFELLIGISGIGPRSALGILNIADTPTLKRAIAEGDTSYLTKVSGVGKKNAQKIILELKEKIELIGEGNSPVLAGDIDTLEALKALGYSTAEARHAIKEIPGELVSQQDRLKAALKILGS